jgi:uncharacterized protein (DUF4415 family)
MAKKNDIMRYTAKDIQRKIARGADRTDWRRVNATSAADVEPSIAADPGDVQGAPDWTQAVMGLPVRKDHINIRIDRDVLEWFRARGKGYQTLMNNVLRAFVTMQQKRNPH